MKKELNGVMKEFGDAVKANRGAVIAYTMKDRSINSSISGNREEIYNAICNLIIDFSEEAKINPEMFVNALVMGIQRKLEKRKGLNVQ